MTSSFPDNASRKKARVATYKRALRREIAKRAKGSEVNFLNITAMLDMMTIILVFLLKSMSQTAASLPQSDDLKLPKSVLTTEASQEGVRVIISKKSIVVEDNEIVPVPANAAQGIEAQYKSDGANGLYITKVGQALNAWREADRVKRVALNKDPNGSEALVIADENTPYRILAEVFYTMGQNEITKFHLMALQRKK